MVQDLKQSISYCSPSGLGQFTKNILEQANGGPL